MYANLMRSPMVGKATGRPSRSARERYHCSVTGLFLTSAAGGHFEEEAKSARLLVLYQPDAIQRP